MRLLLVLDQILFVAGGGLCVRAILLERNPIVGIAALTVALFLTFTHYHMIIREGWFCSPFGIGCEYRAAPGPADPRPPVGRHAAIPSRERDSVNRVKPPPVESGPPRETVQPTKPPPPAIPPVVMAPTPTPVDCRQRATASDEIQPATLRTVGEELSVALCTRLGRIGASEIEAPLAKRGFCNPTCRNDWPAIYAQIETNKPDDSPLVRDRKATVPVQVRGTVRYQIANGAKITLSLQWVVTASNMTHERLALEVDAPRIDPAWRGALYDILAARNVFRENLDGVCSPDRKEVASKDKVLECSMSHAYVKVLQQRPGQGIFASLQSDNIR